MVSTFIFWIHVLVVFLGLSLGFFLPFWVVFLLVVAHRVHMWFLGGCLLSRLEERLSQVAKEIDFLQALVQKIFRKTITASQSFYLDYLLALTPLGVAFARSFF